MKKKSAKNKVYVHICPYQPLIFQIKGKKEEPYKKEKMEKLMNELRKRKSETFFVKGSNTKNKHTSK